MELGLLVFKIPLALKFDSFFTEEFEWNKENTRREEQRILVSLNNSTNTYFKIFWRVHACLLREQAVEANYIDFELESMSD